MLSQPGPEFVKRVGFGSACEAGTKIANEIQGHLNRDDEASGFNSTDALDCWVPMGTKLHAHLYLAPFAAPAIIFARPHLRTRSQGC